VLNGSDSACFPNYTPTIHRHSPHCMTAAARLAWSYEYQDNRPSPTMQKQIPSVNARWRRRPAQRAWAQSSNEHMPCVCLMNGVHRCLSLRAWYNPSLRHLPLSHRQKLRRIGIAPRANCIALPQPNQQSSGQWSEKNDQPSLCPLPSGYL